MTILARISGSTAFLLSPYLPCRHEEMGLHPSPVLYVTPWAWGSKVPIARNSLACLQLLSNHTPSSTGQGEQTPSHPAPALLPRLCIAVHITPSHDANISPSSSPVTALDSESPPGSAASKTKIRQGLKKCPSYHFSWFTAELTSGQTLHLINRMESRQEATAVR